MRLVVFAASFSLLMSSSAFAQQPPNGEAVYRQHCAACHDGSMPRMPSREALRGFTPEHIETALSSFTMRRQGAALSPAERRAVCRVPRGPSCRIVPGAARRHSEERVLRPPAPERADAAGRRGVERLGRRPAQHAVPAGRRGGTRGDRRAAAEAQVGVRLSGRLRVGIPGDGASATGRSSAAATAWCTPSTRRPAAWPGRSRPTPACGRRRSSVRSRAARAGTLYFGDAHAQVYALDAATGALRWKVKVDDHPRRDDHRRRRVPRRAPVRRRCRRSRKAPAVIASYRVLHVPRQRRRARRGHRTADLEDVHDRRRRRGRRRRTASARSCGGRRAAASGPRRRSIRTATACTSRRATATRIPPRRTATPIMALAMDTGRISVDAADAGGRRVERRLPREGQHGPRELSRGGRPRLRLRQLARADDAAGRTARAARRPEVGHAARR